MWCFVVFWFCGLVFVCFCGCCCCDFVVVVLVTIVLLLLFSWDMMHFLSLSFPVAQVRWLSAFLSRSSQGG